MPIGFSDSGEPCGDAAIDRGRHDGGVHRLVQSRPSRGGGELWRLCRGPPGQTAGRRQVQADLEAYLDGLASSTRREAGRKPLAANDRLKRAARAQALDMALGGYVGHDSRNGYGFGERFAAFADPAAVGYHGENAARDRQSGSVDQVKARRLFGQWLDSSGHRRNLLNGAYAHIATGAVQVGHALYAVQIFWQYEPPAAAETSSSSQGGAQFY
jgi:uncharacterized protein YkwD